MLFFMRLVSQLSNYIVFYNRNVFSQSDDDCEREERINLEIINLHQIRILSTIFQKHKSIYEYTDSAFNVASTFNDIQLFLLY